MSLASKLKAKGVKAGTKRKEPLWKGPEDDGPQGGITYSMLCRFLTCRERFRLMACEGLRPIQGFNHHSGYGDMWHVCEESHAANEDWKKSLQAYATGLVTRHQEQAGDVAKWYEVCKRQFPIYVKWWQDHPDVTVRGPIEQEFSFSLPLTLPSGRTIHLRGKMDSLDYIGPSPEGPAGVYLQENKTKGDIDEEFMKRQLSYDLQTGIYLTAAQALQKEGHWPAHSKHKLQGVRYNVIRRPLAGGLHSIQQRKGRGNAKAGSENMNQFLDRLEAVIWEYPQDFFMRWQVLVTPGELQRFQHHCLEPILEALCVWWDWVKNMEDPWRDCNAVHWQYPFGVYNPILEGRATDLDEYLRTGSEVGLERMDALFSELG